MNRLTGQIGLAEFGCDECGNEWIQSFGLYDPITCPECGARWITGNEDIDGQEPVTEVPA